MNLHLFPMIDRKQSKTKVRSITTTTSSKWWALHFYFENSFNGSLSCLTTHPGPTFRVLAVFVSVIFQRYMSWSVGPSVWWSHPAALAEVRIMFPAPCVAAETVFFGSYSALLPNTADWVDAEKLHFDFICPERSTFQDFNLSLARVKTLWYDAVSGDCGLWWIIYSFLHLVCCFSVAPRCQANEVE